MIDNLLYLCYYIIRSVRTSQQSGAVMQNLGTIFMVIGFTLFILFQVSRFDAPLQNYVATPLSDTVAPDVRRSLRLLMTLIVLEMLAVMLIGPAKWSVTSLAIMSMSFILISVAMLRMMRAMHSPRFDEPINWKRVSGDMVLFTTAMGAMALASSL